MRSCWRQRVRRADLRRSHHPRQGGRRPGHTKSGRVAQGTDLSGQVGKTDSLAAAADSPPQDRQRSRFGIAAVVLQGAARGASLLRGRHHRHRPCFSVARHSGEIEKHEFGSRIKKPPAVGPGAWVTGEEEGRAQASGSRRGPISEIGVCTGRVLEEVTAGREVSRTPGFRTWPKLTLALSRTCVPS
jgi:hypothetical protein